MNKNEGILIRIWILMNKNERKWIRTNNNE